MLAGNPVCWLCGQPGADTVDHVVPLSHDASRAYDVTNLRPAHKVCNSRRGNRNAEALAFRVTRRW